MNYTGPCVAVNSFAILNKLNVWFGFNVPLQMYQVYNGNIAADKEAI